MTRKSNYYYINLFLSAATPLTAYFLLGWKIALIVLLLQWHTYTYLPGEAQRKRAHNRPGLTKKGR